MKRYYAAMVLLLLAACGGGGGGGDANGSSTALDPAQQPCAGQCANSGARLTVTDVEQILAQGIAAAQQLGVAATFAVVDRVGNVLAVYRMSGGSGQLAISSSFPNQVAAGLDGIVLPAGADGDALGAISKALTGAYLSSEGNAFSTRTASQIVQQHFNPEELNQPAGPLFGVQFSQLACSDFSRAFAGTGPSPGPHRAPLGLAADPGGFPLYKEGAVVGGIGVIADGRYSLDKHIADNDHDSDEQIASAASFGLAAPVDRRADRITLDGKTLRFSDTDVAASGAAAPVSFADLSAADGSLLAVTGYSQAVITNGTVFGEVASGVRAAAAADFNGLDAFEFVDENAQPRFSPRAGTDDAWLNGAPLATAEVTELLRSALVIASRSRAQIRRPLGSSARVTVSVVDSRGTILGMLRSRDAPLFGADVSLQKARSATFFSALDAADYLNSITQPAIYRDADLMPIAEVFISSYVTAVRSFIDADALGSGDALSGRAIGNLSRPYYPDGIIGNSPGPFSKDSAANQWSVFSTGLQLDISLNRILQHVSYAATGSGVDVPQNCVEAAELRLANGVQIFPGGVPIYRSGELVGGIGVSGDGVDQDDMIAFLGVHQASLALAGSINNAPVELRADQLSPGSARLRYVQCPQSPWLDSEAQNVCDGL